jgi:lipopolysaccharide/colanic/teichoic acid biosynthesis glycosyltransferase
MLNAALQERLVRGSGSAPPLDAPPQHRRANGAWAAAPSRSEKERIDAEVDEFLTAVLNIVVGLMALLFVAPVMIGIAAAVFIHDGGPVLFAHKRVGRNGRHFYCLKFRSMAIDAEQKLADLLANDPVARAEWARDHKLRNDPRITPLGRFLRRSSLDELPQLLNVLCGDMSLVGPRPIVDAEVCRYGHRFNHYCAVRPGITGLWQISGRNDTSYRSRVAMDCLYSRKRSAGLDLTVLALTIPAVLSRRGSY